MSSYDDLYLFCKSEQIPVPANHLPIILGHNYELGIIWMFCSNCPLILEDIRLDINLLTDNGQGQAKEWNDKLVKGLWSFSHFRI